MKSFSFLFAMLLSTCLMSQTNSNGEQGSIGLSISTLDLTNQNEESPLISFDYRLKLSKGIEGVFSYGNQAMTNHAIGLGINKDLFSDRRLRVYAGLGIQYANAERINYEGPDSFLIDRVGTFRFKNWLGVEGRVIDKFSLFLEAELLRFDIYDTKVKQFQTDNLKLLKNSKVGFRYNF